MPQQLIEELWVGPGEPATQGTLPAGLCEADRRIPYMALIQHCQICGQSVGNWLVLYALPGWRFRGARQVKDGVEEAELASVASARQGRDERRRQPGEAPARKLLLGASCKRRSYTRNSDHSQSLPSWLPGASCKRQEGTSSATLNPFPPAGRFMQTPSAAEPGQTGSLA
jgi:hypothetical protein